MYIFSFRQETTGGVMDAAVLKDNVMRAMMPATGPAHPTRPEWMVIEARGVDGRLVEKTTNDPPKPIRLSYDKDTNELLNEQPVAVSEAEKSTTVPWAYEAQEALDEDSGWKHLVVYGLLAAFRKFGDACTLNDETMEIVTLGAKSTLVSKIFWPAGGLILVPKVPGIAYVASKTKKEFHKNNQQIQLARACGSGEDRVWCLVPASKIPKKGIDPRASPDKWIIVPAWVARRSADSKECNMEVKEIPVESLLQVGTGAETYQSETSTVIPVFFSSKEIKAGDEVVVFAANPPKSAKTTTTTTIWQQQFDKKAK